MEKQLDSANYASENIPLFVRKLSSLLKGNENTEYITWNLDGTAFIVKDQHQFSKIVLPKYFKHSNFSSFMRQLHLYGFKKVDSMRTEGDIDGKLEFKQEHFIREREDLLVLIKRKVTRSLSISKDKINKTFEDVKKIQTHQDEVTGILSELQRENQDLWHEVLELRQKHTQQQKVIKKIVHFLVSMARQHNLVSGLKRGSQLMIEGGQNHESQSPVPNKIARTQNFNDTSLFEDSTTFDNGQSTNTDNDIDSFINGLFPNISTVNNAIEPRTNSYVTLPPSPKAIEPVISSPSLEVTSQNLTPTEPQPTDPQNSNHTILQERINNTQNNIDSIQDLLSSSTNENESMDLSLLDTLFDANQDVDFSNEILDGSLLSEASTSS